MPQRPALHSLQDQAERLWAVLSVSGLALHAWRPGCSTRILFFLLGNCWVGGGTGTLCGHTCPGIDGESGLTWPLRDSEGEEPRPWATDSLGLSPNRTIEYSVPAGCVCVCVWLPMDVSVQVSICLCLFLFLSEVLLPIG